MEAAGQKTVFFPSGEAGGCQDAVSAGGFNTFGFLSFLLAAFNIVSLVANNNNNSQNDNNENNDNNNNAQQTLESSVSGQQTVGGRGRRGAWQEGGQADLAVSADLLVRAWLRNQASDQPGCHMLSICRAAPAPPTSSLQRRFVEAGQAGLARALGGPPELQTRYRRAGAAGRAGRDCATLYPHCPDWEAMRAVEAVLYTPARLLLAKYMIPSQNTTTLLI